MSRDVVDHGCERGILGLVLGILILGPLALGAVEALPFLIIQGMTLGVMLLWGVRLWVNPRARLLWPPICWAVVAFALYAVGRYWTCDIEYVGRLEMIRVLVYAFLFLAIVNNLSSRESTRIVSFTLVFLGMAIAGYAIYQFLTGSERVWTYQQLYKHRGSGTYMSPNHLAGFLEMLLPLGLAYALTGRGKALPRILLGYAALVILAGIAVTVSRGGWLATVCALIAFFGLLALRPGHRLTALVTLALLLIGAAFLAPKSDIFRLRLQGLMAGGRVDDDLRFSLWEPAWRMWEDYPWWGVGPDHFNTRFRQYRPPEVQRQPDKAHNDYLNTLADWGAVGFALVSAAGLLLAAGLVKTSRSVGPSPNDLDPRVGSDKFAFLLGATAGLGAILIHSMVDFNMHIPANAIVAVTLLALISAHLRFATDRYWVRPGVVGKLGVSLGLAAGLVCLGAQGWRRAREQVWLSRAEKAAGSPAQQAELLKKAFAAEPKNSATAYAIGELYRTASLEGAENYDRLGSEAMQWFQQTMQLNKWDGYGFLRYGQCLDWLDRRQESGPYFNQADRLDPNGCFLQAHIGIHYVSLGDYAAARPWFERSLRLEAKDNLIASNYLQITTAALLRAATNRFEGGLAAPR